MIWVSWFRLQAGLLRTYCVGLCVSGKCMICGTSGLHTCRIRGGGKGSLLNLCVWRVALLIGMSGGGLIDGLIACSPNLE